MGTLQADQYTSYHMLSSGLFPSVFSLNANVSEHSAPSSYLLDYEDGKDRVFQNAGI
jgi:hypothetical protein